MNQAQLDITALLDPEIDQAAAGIALRQIGVADPSEAAALVATLLDQRQRLAAADPAILGALLRGLHLLLLRGGAGAVERIDVAALTALDAALPPGCPNRHLLLHLLVMRCDAPALGAVVTRLLAQPPQDWEQAGHLLSPLMQRDDWPPEAVFPALLDCLESPALASPVLDLANHLRRRRRVDRHPAASRVANLVSLLAAVTSRLERFEADPRSFGDDVPTVQQRLGEAVALAVSLLDAIGLIGDVTAIPRLAEAMQLRHRRVQAEAAGALARLGDAAGIERLVALAEEPSARLRVITYADELGVGARIGPQYRSQESTAEAALALWLSQPAQFGVPPTSVETIDRRHQYWPSYEQPLDCFLVHFQYDLGAGSYSNVGISGPVTFALANSVADLPIDDIYAIYAGWQAEHDDIFAIGAEHLNQAQRRLVDQLAAAVQRAGYESPEVELFGVFLDEQAAVYRALRDDKPCRVITDGLEMIHLPITNQPRQLDGADLWNLYKGRKMLRVFNPLGD